MNTKEFKQYIKSSGTSFASYKKMIKTTLILNKLYQQEIFPNIKINLKSKNIIFITSCNLY